VHNEAVLMSATDRYEIWKALLPTLELGEVNDVFAAHYAPGGFAYVVTLPEKPDVKLPTDAEVLAAARAAQARKTEPLADEDRGEPLLESEPTPGRIVERTRDEDLDITSGWLENGVAFPPSLHGLRAGPRVRHRDAGRWRDRGDGGERWHYVRRDARHPPARDQPTELQRNQRSDDWAKDPGQRRRAR
jgi:hypothetical protein